MMALTGLTKSVVGSLGLQSPNTDAEWELINAYHDGRLWLAAIVIVIIVIIVKQFKTRP
jgi:hypothetical protein